MSAAYRKWVIERLAKGMAAPPKRPKKKNAKRLPGEAKPVALPPEKQAALFTLESPAPSTPADTPRRPSVNTKTLVGKTPQNRFRLAEIQLEAELLNMRKEGVIICTDGEWRQR